MTSASATAANNALSKLQVQRGLEQFELAPGQDLKPGDVIRNLSDQPARVGAVSRVPELSSQVATLPPGSAIRVTERGEPTDEVLGLQSVDGTGVVADASDEIAGATEYVITPEVVAVAGLFGAAPLLAGATGPIAGAVGLAALLAGDNSDGNGDAPATTNGGGGLLPDGSVADTLRNGVSGLLDSVNSGVADTPLAPATALTDATAGTPLAAIADPLTGALGGNAIELGGLASGVADLGSALPTGDTPLGGLFDTLLTPLVGASQASTGTGTDPAGALLDTLTGATAPLSSLAGGSDPLTSALANLAPV